MQLSSTDDSSVIVSRSKVLDRGSEDTRNQEAPSGLPSNYFLQLLEFVDSCSNVPVWDRLLPVSGLHRIGEGTSFVVKIVAFPHPSMPDICVCKIPRLAFDRRSTSQSYDSLEVRRLQSLVTEVTILSHTPLRSHPNIVNILGLEWFTNPLTNDKLSVAIMLEYAELGSLSDFQISGARITISQKLDLCLDIGKGLSALHGCGVVHGDVKSENVLIFNGGSKEYVAKISDFGGAVITNYKSQPGSLSFTRTLRGTPLWAAPETGAPIRLSELKLTDVYSFGLLVWTVLVDGKNPFSFLDVPLDASVHFRQIRQFLQIDLSDLVRLIATTISIHYGGIAEDMQHTLLMIFILTLAQDPRARDFSAALEILHRATAHNGTVHVGYFIYFLFNLS